MHTLLAVPGLDLRRDNWLYAKTFKFFNRTALFTYRSTWLAVDDPWCEEVWDFVKKNMLELAWSRKGVILDVDIMFDSGELSIHVSPSENGMGLSSELISELQAEGRRIIQELAS